MNVFDLKNLSAELKDIEQKLQSPDVWSNQNLASELGANIDGFASYTLVDGVCEMSRNR